MYPDCADRDNPSNTVLGASQKSWLQAQLEAERGHWSVLANPVTMTPVPLYPNSHNMDWWDGYPAERREVLASLSGVRNPVVLSGARALGGAN